MKYFIILILLFVNTHLLPQNQNVPDSLKPNRSSISVFFGLHIDEFNKPLIGMSYELSFKPNLSHSFEFQGFTIQKPNYFVAISTSIKYYLLNVQQTKFYLQGGAGLVLTYPAPFLFGSFGVIYWKVFFEIKTLAAEGLPTFLSIGVKF